MYLETMPKHAKARIVGGRRVGAGKPQQKEEDLDASIASDTTPLGTDNEPITAIESIEEQPAVNPKTKNKANIAKEKYANPHPMVRRSGALNQPRKNNY
eukprot:m.14900 g.14900  ORF g.14900 m.14900 type:complete len:99 (+) comp5245_c0_seq2:287-583(+)